MEIYTIGHKEKSAREFFETLKRHRIRRLIDVRLINNNVFVTFTKRDDLEYFLAELCGAEYIHDTSLAPTKALLDAYKEGTASWDDYEREFGLLLRQRAVEDRLDKALFSERTVLLCSEVEADNCHRRLVAEYLSERWGGGVVITHL